MTCSNNSLVEVTVFDSVITISVGDGSTHEFPIFSYPGKHTQSKSSTLSTHMLLFGQVEDMQSSISTSSSHEGPV